MEHSSSLNTDSASMIVEPWFTTSTPNLQLTPLQAQHQNRMARAIPKTKPTVQAGLEGYGVVAVVVWGC